MAGLPPPAHPSFPDVPPRKIRVLIVDDSALMRRVMTEMVHSEPDLTVVGEAHDGQEAIAKACELQPDVVTLDVRMPGTDGLTALREIMRISPRPVVMVSYLTREGAEATMQALMLGAVDVVLKPSGPISLDLEEVRQELVHKLRVAARARVPRRPTTRPLAAVPHAGRTDVPYGPPSRIGAPTLGQGCERLVAIGASTGGPSALSVVVAGLPRLPGVGYLVVQHMPEWLSPWLAERLAGVTGLEVREAQEGDRLLPGRVLVAPGDQHLRVGAGGVVHLDRGPKVNRVRPSIDVAFLSALEVFGSHIVAAILTGIGDDGAAAAVEIRRRGGFVIAEDESTCVVWGMPRAVVERGGANRVEPLEDVAPAIGAALAAVAA